MNMEQGCLIVGLRNILGVCSGLLADELYLLPWRARLALPRQCPLALMPPCSEDGALKRQSAVYRCFPGNRNVSDTI